MSPAGFGPQILARERSQTHTLERAATGISKRYEYTYTYTYTYT